MTIRRGVVSSGFNVPPIITNFNYQDVNQEYAIATVDVDYSESLTSVKFQYSTSNTFSTYNEVNYSNLTTVSGNNKRYKAEISSLSENTTYYLRAVVSPVAGWEIVTNAQSFTTWSLQVYAQFTAGQYFLTIPNVYNLSGNSRSLNIYDVIIFGGGGAGADGGGGGGGAGKYDTDIMPVANNIVAVVGNGGLNWSSGPNNFPSFGESSYIQDGLGGDFRGLGGLEGIRDDDNNDRSGGNSANGNTGGLTKVYDYNPGDKLGFVNYAYGGGAGYSENGFNGIANSSGTTGGDGGDGVAITRGGVTITGGAGGGGYAAALDGGSAAQGADGLGVVGSGGRGSLDTEERKGRTGVVRFRYYAASQVL